MGSAITDNRRSIFFSIRWTYSFLGSLWNGDDREQELWIAS
jgi:hypothetical protein